MSAERAHAFHLPNHGYQTVQELRAHLELAHGIGPERYRFAEGMRHVEAHNAARYHLTITGFNAGATLCGGPKTTEDRHAAWNGSLWNAPRDVLVGDGCCPECAALWTDAA